MHIKERLAKLQQSLVQENPVLLDVVASYQRLDRVAQGLGVLDKASSYAEQISWWPLISVLGTFSAGKSSFINQFIGRVVQDTGNQAVDDRFTVICYGTGEEVMTLPGLALDADPRFPFYGVRHEIDRISAGEGNRIDHYLQLKTVPASQLKGRILIDSPGFDADSQRDTVLKIADHIMGMSDLVLVFFDARHPEPGAMRDTLKHLVEGAQQRHDADKFLFILNQIDTAANEDNPEAIMGAWQRALASAGLVGGKFYMIYNESAAGDFKDAALAARFKRKKDSDLAEIYARMDKVSVERAYRISFALESLADDLEKTWIPKADAVRLRWAKRVALSDLALAAVSMSLLLWVKLSTFWLTDIDIAPLTQNINTIGVAVAAGVFVLLAPHYYFRFWWANRLAQQLMHEDPSGALTRMLRRNTVFWRPMFAERPRGWCAGARKQLTRLRAEAKQAIQKLNDQFAKPTGEEIVRAD
ncbi:MAG: dynamin family protein [Proteobacteria bacterium]|nr:dynamin family protein [Pseudomonadota bacterium]